MRVRHDALVCFAAIAALAAALTGDAFAQGKYSNSNGSQNNLAAGMAKVLPRGMAGRFTPLRSNAVNGAPTGKGRNFVAPRGGVAVAVPPRALLPAAATTVASMGQDISPAVVSHCHPTTSKSSTTATLTIRRQIKTALRNARRGAIEAARRRPMSAGWCPTKW